MKNVTLDRSPLLQLDARVRQSAQIQPSVPGTNRPSGVRRGAKITRTAMLVAMPMSFSQRQ
jgi:hypothetical protein